MLRNDGQAELPCRDENYFKKVTYNKWKKIFRPREPVSGFSHLLGAFLAIWGLYLLIKTAPANASTACLASLYVFGASLILLYTASANYHLLNISEKGIRILRRLDHMMIYVLIAGTYTPICMIVLEGIWRWGLLLSIWVLAFIGMMLKLVWFNAPRSLSTLFYIIMGWLVIIAIFPLSKTLSFAAIIWLILGGLSYTVGAIIYASKRPRINSRLFGFHEIFHFFVLAGSFCHYWLVFNFII